MVWSQVANGEAEIKMASNKVNKPYQRAETTWYCSYVRGCECGKLPYAQNVRPIIVYRKLLTFIYLSSLLHPHRLQGKAFANTYWTS